MTLAKTNSPLLTTMDLVEREFFRVRGGSINNNPVVQRGTGQYRD